MKPLKISLFTCGLLFLKIDKIIQMGNKFYN
jgi:hypothetical protein